MRFARDFNGFLVDAKINNRHGNFICIICHNLVHWRRMSVNGRSPHFYHAEANEDCPLSVFGGIWNLLENDSVEYRSELKREQFIFPRKIMPNLSKIPLGLIADSKPKEKISPTIVNIRLKSLDHNQLDSTLLLFSNLLKSQKVKFFGAIPLPTKILSVRGEESSTKRIHCRLLRVVGVTPELMEKLSFLNIPNAVDIELRSHFTP